MSRIIAALFVLAALWFPQHAHAACTFETTDGEMPRIRFPAFDTGSFDPDAIAVGGVIAMRSATQTSAENGVSPTNIRWDCGDQSGMLRAGTTAPAPTMYGGKPVYQTALAGVGVSIKFTNCSPLGYWPASSSSMGKLMTFGCMLQVELIKTGPITGGTISGEFAGYYSIVGGTPYQVASLLFSGDIHVTPNKPTCLPTVTDRIVDMGSLDVGSITDDGYSDPVNFNMDVVCSGGDPDDTTQQMSVTFTDATNANNTTDKLLLTSASTASGVKVQLLQGGTPVTFGPEPTNGADTTYSRALGTIKNGTYTFPLAARYVQTGSVTAGSANAMATFTYTYH